MQEVTSLLVQLNGRTAGRLSRTPDRVTAFEYDAKWLASGFAVSPFSLPLKPGIFKAPYYPFGGLFGIFADSLPESWGRLLLKRRLARDGINADDLCVLQRLSIIGSSGMGALTYLPEINLAEQSPEPKAGAAHKTLDEIAALCAAVLKRSKLEQDAADELYRLGGATGGSRPKILADIDGEPWLIKFPHPVDNPDLGEAEYAYAQCARDCGLDMPDTRLFASKTCSGYFGVRRFDRQDGGTKRVHMASAAALLETDAGIPNLDYNDLMQLTLQLTHDNAEVEKMFRLMTFNVFAHNRDDHSRNFSYVCDDNGRWSLSPAYDLTYSTSMAGEHATTVNGNGKNPGSKDLLAVAQKIGMDLRLARQIVKEIQEKAQPFAARYRPRH